MPRQENFVHQHFCTLADKVCLQKTNDVVAITSAKQNSETVEKYIFVF